MKKTRILFVGAVLLMMTGCADTGITTDYEQWAATSEYSVDAISEDYQMPEATAEEGDTMTKDTEESLARTDAQGSDNAAESGDADTTGEQTAATDAARYTCDNFTFYKAGNDVDVSGSYQLIGVYEDEALAEYHGLFIGQIVTLFGDKETSQNNEEMLDYTIAAEDKEGKVIYLTLYYGPSGPAIGGWDGDEYMKAATELEKLVRTTEPVDYECSSVYEDLDVTIRMGTRNGRGFYETEMPEDMGWYDY